MNKSIIFCLVCILVACQLANCSTHASSRIVSSNMGTSTSLIEEPTRQSSVNNLETTNAISSIAQTKSTFSPVSTKACPCTDCSTDIDKSNNFYSWNVTCADPRNYAYIDLDIGSDNPKELYTVFYLESAEYMKMRLGVPSVYFEQFIVNCLSNRTVFQSSSVIAAYFCTSTDLLNSTICTTKYKFSSGCYIGLNSIGITSNFNGSLLFIQVNLYGNDGLTWANSDSKVRVSVNGTNYSNVSTLQNLQQGTLIFTFNIPSTTVPYNILVEADDIFGIKSHVGIQEAEFRLAGPSLLVGTGSGTTSGGVSSQLGFSFGMVLSLLVLLSLISL